MKILNPYNNLEGHHCFGCSARNPIGLKLDFELEDDTVIARWMPHDDYMGFHNVLHGGISTTLLDEVAFWAVATLLGSSGVTSQIDLKFLKPVLIPKGEITVTAKLKEQCGPHEYKFKTQLFDGAGTLCVEGDVTYFVYSQAVAEYKFHYPGKAAFGV